MVIYSKSAEDFMSDVDNNTIVDELEKAFRLRLGWVPSKELPSWNNSLRFMETAVRKSGVPSDCGVMIEYRIPATAKRIDFIIAGEDDSGAKNAVIIELKQWQNAKSTTMDGVVMTILGGGLHETAHPSYQASSYRSLLLDFNENVYSNDISVSGCAYLHNYGKGKPEPLLEGHYKRWTDESPLFFKHDAEKLQEFIRKFVGHGKGMPILYDIEGGRIRPSKKLVDHVAELFKGNEAFTLIDGQKVAFEKALQLATHRRRKTVVVVKGGPGTGKSVISMNLLSRLLGKSLNTVFVAPNAAFREVILKTLTREKNQIRVRHLFKGSGSFVNVEPDTYDVVIVDEAHRLKGEGAYQYWGKNQVEDVIKAGFCTVLFIDDSQQVRPDDIGSVKEIRRVAKQFDAKIHEMELEAQYRCAGAEGFVNWIDDVLQLRETANFDGWDRKDFEFDIVDNPNELREKVLEKNKQGHTGRLLAGYAWDWTSEKKGNPSGEIEDVVIEKHDFRMPWNSRRARTTWAIDPSGIDQVGCIHTSQGLEFDYVGVIIGTELQIDSTKNVLCANWDNYKDSTGKRGLRGKPDELTQFVKQIYRTLMSRAQRGCFVYICDSAVGEYFRDRLRAIGPNYDTNQSP